MTHIPSDKREEWDAMLVAPLPTRRKRPTAGEVEAEGAAFMDLMGKAQGGRL